MSHRRYGKPVRLGYKAPSLLLSSFLSQRRCLSSVSSRPRPFVPPPAPSPTLCLSSIIARSLFYLLSPPPPSPSLSPPSLSLSFSLSLRRSLYALLLLPWRDLTGPTAVFNIFNRHFVAPRMRISKRRLYRVSDKTVDPQGGHGRTLSFECAFCGQLVTIRKSNTRV